MSSQLSTIVLILSLSFLTACGQKGPLFLPGEDSQISTDIPIQIPPPAASTEEEDDDDEEPESKNE